MGLIKSLQRRLNGSYRANEIAMHSARIAYLQWHLRQKQADAKIADAFQDLIAALQKEISKIRAGYWLGGATATMLYSVSPCYQVLQRHFLQGEKLRYKDIAIPPAAHSRDAKECAQQFFEFMLPHLTGDDLACIEDDSWRSIRVEDPYEISDKVMLKTDMVVFDCGANMGYFSALASQRGCYCHAFEPVKETRTDYLEKTAAWNKNITAHPYALSDRNEELLFKLDPKNIGANRAVENAGSRNATQPGYEQVAAVSLDSFAKEQKIEQLDFLKADIEGAERKMLAGAAETIRRFSPIISLCTYHLPDDPEVLSGLIKDIQPKYQIIQGNDKLYAYLEHAS